MSVDSFDMTETTAAKSDQQNYDDYVGGPRTVTIDFVERVGGDQPVSIHLIGYPGKPFKPSKTVRRLIVRGWGGDTSTYAGRRLRLYGDASVKFGGQAVGGIRVSHMSHIDKQFKVALTESKGKKRLFTVDPLPDEPQHAPGRDTPSIPRDGDVFALLTAKGCPPDQQLGYIADTLGRTITGPDDLTPADVALVTAALEAKP